MSIDATGSVEVMAVDSFESLDRQAARRRFEEARCAYANAVRLCVHSDQLSSVATLFARKMAEAEEDMYDAD